MSLQTVLRIFIPSWRGLNAWTFSRPSMKYSFWFPILILAYFIVGVLSYAAATPLFEAPDEASHLLYVHNLHNMGQLPILEDRATVFASRAVQRHHPPLYYLLASLLLTGTTRDDLSAYLHDNPFAHYGTVTTYNANVLLHPLQPTNGDTIQAAGRLRLLSLMFACGTLWCIYRVGVIAFGRGIGCAAMLFAASIPSFVAISGSINNDNAVTFFYSAGIAWVVWVWQKRTLRPQDALILGAILSGAALSKITGLTLIGFVGLVMLCGGLSGRLSWRALVQAGMIAGLCGLVLAGWWYARNVLLYGDALALAATNAIWGRSPPTDPMQVRSEAWGVWESFWLILGHFNVRGPDWLYPYVTGISLMSAAGVLIGIIRAWREGGTQQSSVLSTQKSHGRTRHVVSLQLILLCAVGIVVAALVIATRSVNVSQGRILFPALAAFCPLCVYGLSLWGRWAANILRPARTGLLWHSIDKAFLLLLLPLMAAHLMTPFVILPTVYAPPRPVAALPVDAIPIEADAQGLRVVGYHIDPDTMMPDDSLRIRVYIQGTHAADPVLYLKIIDPVTLVPVGGADVYPGMTMVSQFDPHQLYEIALTLPIDRTRLTGRTPRRMDVVMGWHVLGDDPTNSAGASIPWTLADGTQSDSLRVVGVTLIDPDYAPTPPIHTVNVIYGTALELVGYTVSPQTAQAGDSVAVTLVWRGLGTLPDDWTLALGLLDASNTVIAQADGPILGYPTSAWRSGAMIEDTRTLTLPAGTAAGDLHLFIGWYRPTDANQRLAAQGTGIENDLYLSPPVVTVR